MVLVRQEMLDHTWLTSSCDSFALTSVPRRRKQSVFDEFVDIGVKSGAAKTSRETSVPGRSHVTRDKGPFHLDRKPLQPPYECPDPGPERCWFGQSRSRNHLLTGRGRLRRADISTLHVLLRHVSKTIKGHRACSRA